MTHSEKDVQTTDIVRRLHVVQSHDDELDRILNRLTNEEHFGPQLM